MKITVTKPTEIEVAFVRLELAVRYEEEDIPYDFPLRSGDMWRATVVIDNGEIQDWPKGYPAFQLHMKVTDCGSYTLLNHANEPLASLENEYVPHGVVPGEYGDYVILNIKDGVITNWPKKPDVSAFFPNDDA